MARRRGGSASGSRAAQNPSNRASAAAATQHPPSQSLEIAEFYQASVARDFTAMLFVKAPKGLPTVLLVSGATHQLPQDARVVLGVKIDQDHVQLGLPGGTFVYAARLDDVQDRCWATAEGARLFQAPPGTKDRSEATFIPGSRHIMGKGLRCYTLAGEVITIPQGDFVTCGVTPNLFESDSNIIKAVVGGGVHYVPFSPQVLKTMAEHGTLIVADGQARTIDEQPIQDHVLPGQFVQLPPITVANDLIGCGAQCQKVEVKAGQAIDWLFLDHSGLRYCRKRATGETYIFAYLTRDVQDQVEAVYDTLVLRGTMKADVDIALERFLVANDHPVLHDEDECGTCHHFFGVHDRGCAGGGAPTITSD